MFRLFTLPFLAALCVVALDAPETDAGPLCKLVHKVTHPLESFRENRAERQAARHPAPQAAPKAIPQRLPEGPMIPKDAPPAAPKSVAPTVTVVPTSIFVPANAPIPAAPAGYQWVRFRCERAGCWYRAMPLPPQAETPLLGDELGRATGFEKLQDIYHQQFAFKCRCANCQRADCEAKLGTGPCLCRK